MSIYVAPRPAPPVEVKAGPTGPGSGVLQTEFPLGTYGSLTTAKNAQRRMQLAWNLSYQVPWIAAAEDAICSRFSTVDWHLEDGADVEIDDAYPNPDAQAARSLIEFPSRNLTVGAPFYRTDLWNLTARAMGVCGSGFLLLDQPELLADTPAAMLPIAPWRFTPQEDQQGNLLGWWIDRTDTAQGIPVKLSEVLHIPLRRRFEGHFGVGLIESAGMKPELASKLDAHLALVLSGGGRLSGILSPKTGVIETETMLQMERDWRTIVEQSDAAKRLQLVRAPIDFQKTTLSPQELQIRDLMDGARDDLLTLWGVPLSALGGKVAGAGMNGNSGASRKEDNQQIWEGPVHARIVPFREVMQYQLLDRWSGLGCAVELEIDEPVFDDDSPRFDLLGKSLNTPMTNKERRALIGLEPFGDPALDNAIVLPVTTVAYATAPDDSMGPAVLPTSVPAAQMDARQTPQMMAAGEMPEPEQKAKVAPLRASLVRLRASIQERVTPRMRSSVADVLAEQKTEIAARIRRNAAQVMADPRRHAAWWDGARWDKRMREAMAGHIAGVADTISSHIATVLPPMPAKAAVDAATRVLTRGAARVTKINDTTRDAIAEELAAIIEAGGTIDDAIAALDGLSAFDSYRAELIARTELMDAYNGAALASYGDAGLGFVQAIDGDEDEECAARDGQTFPIDEADTIEDHPNGTLDWVPVIE